MDEYKAVRLYRILFSFVWYGHHIGYSQLCASNTLTIQGLGYQGNSILFLSFLRSSCWPTTVTKISYQYRSLMLDHLPPRTQGMQALRYNGAMASEAIKFISIFFLPEFSFFLSPISVNISAHYYQNWWVPKVLGEKMASPHNGWSKHDTAPIMASPAVIGSASTDQARMENAQDDKAVESLFLGISQRTWRRRLRRIRMPSRDSFGGTRKKRRSRSTRCFAMFLPPGLIQMRITQGLSARMPGYFITLVCGT